MDELTQVCELLNTNNTLLVVVMLCLGFILGVLLIRELWSKW